MALAFLFNFECITSQHTQHTKHTQKKTDWGRCNEYMATWDTVKSDGYGMEKRTNNRNKRMILKIIVVAGFCPFFPGYWHRLLLSLFFALPRWKSISSSNARFLLPGKSNLIWLRVFSLFLFISMFRLCKLIVLLSLSSSQPGSQSNESVYVR